MAWVALGAPVPAIPESGLVSFSYGYEAWLLYHGRRCPEWVRFARLPLALSVLVVIWPWPL